MNAPPTQTCGQIVLVEGNGDTRRELETLLLECGVSVVSLANLDENSTAEILQQENRPVVIFSATDKATLAIMCELKERAPALPALIYSALAPDAETIDFLRRPSVEFVQSPLQARDLFLVVTKKSLINASLQHENIVNSTRLQQANRDLQSHLRVMERDHLAGRVVQKKMLPHTPAKLGEIDVSFKIIPSFYLSGDVVDYGLLQNRFLAFYLTDVSGHGAASAFVGVWIRQLVRGLLRERQIFHDRRSFEEDAPQLMHLINVEMLRAELGCHLTSFVGVLDTETRELRYVVAGHLPLPILHTEESSCYLEGSGKPLGLFPGASWETQRLHLPERFCLSIFSDGILEVLPGMDIIERERYLLEKMHITGAADIAGIAEAFELNDTDAVQDDIALLILKRRWN